MASAIDATKPVAGNPTTESVRANFAAAKSEIEVLQQTAGVGPTGPAGPTGPSGTITVGTVTTGAAGGSAAVTNSGTPQAAVFNFTLPRGDAGTGGSGITETQAIDAVRHGNPQFLESPETLAVSFPTTPNLAQAPVVGAGWTPASGTATQAYTHAVGSTEPLAYPASISNGSVYQVVFSMTNVAATSTVTGNFFVIYFRNGPTNTTGQQTVIANVNSGQTVTITATSAFTHVVVVPVSGWQGNFTMTRVVVFTGAQNSVTLGVKDWMVRARSTSLYIGTGGKLATGTDNITIGSGAGVFFTAASQNIAIGTNALSRNFDSSSNVAVGHSAIQNGIGNNNTALGYNAMQSITTGYNNTAVGSYSGYGSASGISHDNTSLGYYSQFYGLNVSHYNVAIGGWCGFRGSYNVGVGFKALAFAAGPPGELIGEYNVGLGYQAGSFIASGSHTAADNSIFLGANTRAAANAETNQIVIGYNAIGHGSNTITLGNSSITHLHCNVQVIDALSDSRVKENVQPANLDMCLNVVKSLILSEWDWLPISGAHANKHALGFMADDVARVWPKAVSKEDTFLTVVNPDGSPQMTSVTDPAWTPPDGGPVVPASTRLIEKTQEFKDLQYVSLAEALPTLWGAVQALIQRVEQLQITPGSDPSASVTIPEERRGLFRGKK